MGNGPELNKYAVWAPDHTDADAPARRRAVQPAHFEGIHKLIKDGTIRAGGGVVTSEESINAGPGDRRYFGSCIIIEAESLDAARKIIESDIYYTTGVWDKKELRILPILLAAPLPPVPVDECTIR